MSEPSAACWSVSMLQISPSCEFAIPLYCSGLIVQFSVGLWCLTFSKLCLKFWLKSIVWSPQTIEPPFTSVFHMPSSKHQFRCHVRFLQQWLYLCLPAVTSGLVKHPANSCYSTLCPISAVGPCSSFSRQAPWLLASFVFLSHRYSVLEEGLL